MQVHESFDDVPEEVSGLLNSESTRIVEILKQSPSIHILKNQVYILLILEEAIEFNDFRMVKRTVQLNFFGKLFNHIELFDFGLANFLYCNNESSFDVSCQVNLSEFAFTQHRPEFELMVHL